MIHRAGTYQPIQKTNQFKKRPQVRPREHHIGNPRREFNRLASLLSLSREPDPAFAGIAILESKLGSGNLSKPNYIEPASPSWMKWMLIAAGSYNLAFGVFAIVFPLAIFKLIAMEPPKYPELWQCIGMIVGVYGIGYIIAAFAPARHWPIVLVGFLGKLFGPIGMAWAVYQGSLPLNFGLANVTNDLIWLIPFALVLMHARRFNLRTREAQLGS